jgi:hypothetical protein
MMPITQASRNVADALTKQAYGRTFKEVDNALVKTIVLLYSQMKMSVEEIAEKIELEAKFVISVLKKHKLIKK